MAGPFDWLTGPRNSLLDGAPMYQGGPQASAATGNFVPAPNRLLDYARRVVDPQTPDERMAVNVVRGFAESPAAIRAYHGSPVAGLETLSPSQRGPFGPVTYLSPAEHVAKQYAGSGPVYHAELPDEIFHGAGRTWMPDGANPYDVARSQIKAVTEAAPAEHRAAIEAAADRTMRSGDGGYQFFGELSRILRSQEDAAALLQRSGFKGISGIVDGPEIGMFGPVPIAGHR